jgi:hypothetical protein
MLSEERLRQIEERVNGADEGPWCVEGCGGIRMDGTRDGYDILNANHQRVRRVHFTRGNADFIARARQDVPDLLAEVRRLQAKLAKVIAVGHNEDCMFCGFKDCVVLKDGA